MLAEKQYVGHEDVRKLTITAIFFLSLVLLSATSSASGCNDCIQTAAVIPTGGVEIPWPGSDIFIDVTLSANSIIPLFLSGHMQSTGYLCGTLMALELPMSAIKAVKWQLKNPSGGLVYEKDVTGDWRGFSALHFSLVCVPDPEIRVPAFAQQGSWTLTLMVSTSATLWEHTFDLGRFRFNVGESSTADNLFAPFYLMWGGIMGVLAFSVPIPGIFWITSPFWGFAIFFISLAYYKKSVRLAVLAIKESGKRFRGAVARKL